MKLKIQYIYLHNPCIYSYNHVQIITLFMAIIQRNKLGCGQSIRPQRHYMSQKFLTPLHSEWSKLHKVLAVPSTIGLIKGNGYTFRGSNFAVSIFSPISKGINSLQRKNCYLRSRSFPLRTGLILEGPCWKGKQTGSHKVVSLCINGRKWQNTHSP